VIKLNDRRALYPNFGNALLLAFEKGVITGMEIYEGQDLSKSHAVGDRDAWDTATVDLQDKTKKAFSLSIAADSEVLTRNANLEVFMIVQYSLQ